MEKKRIEYIDIIKAICIFLVVIAHSGITSATEKQWLNSFVMPTFFAVTGMTYNIESHAKRGFLTVGFVINKLKRLLLPYFIWGFGYLIIHFIISRSFSIKSILMLFYGTNQSLHGAKTFFTVQGPLWFLPCMFLAVCFVELIFQIIYKRFKNERRRNIAIAAAAIVLSVIPYIMPQIKWGYPWGANIAVMATAFILIGYLFGQVINRVEGLKNENTVTWLVIFIITFIAVTLTFKFNVKLSGINNVNMSRSVYGIYPIFMFDAIAGLVMTTAASVLLSKLKYHEVLTYVGQSSFVIFLVHKPIVVGLRIALVAMGYKHWLFTIPLAVITIIIICPISMLINKYIPEIAGGSRSKKVSNEKKPNNA